MKTESISVIIPTYKEAGNLEAFLMRISNVLGDLFADWEIIVTDDDSRDGTDEICAGLCTQGLPVQLITRTGKRDLSAAVLCGFQRAKGDVLVVMDADFSHSPDDISAIVNAILEGADIAIGSRFIRQAGISPERHFLRRLATRVAIWLVRPLTGVRDPTAGFFAISRQCLSKAAPLSPIGWKIGLELIIKCPEPRIVEVPTYFAERKIGKSKLNFRQQLLYLKHLRRLYHYRYPVWSEVVHVGFVGAGGLCLDIAVFLMLTGFGGINNFAAKFFSFIAAASSNWFFNRRFSFVRAAYYKPVGQWGRFVLVSGVGVAVNLFVFGILITNYAWFAQAPAYAVVPAAAASATWNFLAYKFVVFKTAW